MPVSVLTNIPQNSTYSPYHVSYIEDGFLWKFFLRDVFLALSLDLFHSLCRWLYMPFARTDECNLRSLLFYTGTALHVAVH